MEKDLENLFNLDEEIERINNGDGEPHNDPTGDDYRVPPFEPEDSDNIPSYMLDDREKFKNMMDKALNRVNDVLSLEKSYTGKVYEVSYEFELYQSITITYEIIDDGQSKFVNDVFMFGGDYDSFTASRLAKYIKNIRNLYAYDLNLNSPKEMANSLKFLEGADVILKPYMSPKNYRLNEVQILGVYNRKERRMEVR